MLRADNADQRLTCLGWDAGCVSEERFERYKQVKEQLEEMSALLKSKDITTQALQKLANVNAGKKLKSHSFYELFGQGTINDAVLLELMPEAATFPQRIRERIMIESMYEVYTMKQHKEIEMYRRDENELLPDDINYNELEFLSIESRHKLQKYRPASLAQAAEISGVSPAGLFQLLRHIRTHRVQTRAIEADTM